MSEEKKGLNISARSFVIAIAVIFALMVLSYALTFVIPGGQYVRIADGSGNELIDTSSEFSFVQGGLPFWKWLLSPVLVLGAPGSVMLISVIIFLLVVGGVFNALEKCGLMQYMLGRLTARFGGARYKLMAAIVLFFMGMGALVGSFEECIPMVPIVVALAVSLGWDALTGLGMSLLAVGCGFSSGLCNPFTVGVAQRLSGLSMFSGIWLRLVALVCIYALLMLFLRAHAKRVERPVAVEAGAGFEKTAAMDRALISFALILGLGIALVLVSGVVTALQDFTMIIVALMFLIAGIVSPRLAGMRGKEFGRVFFNGVVSILPAALMLMMASSIRYILDEAHILDTILYGAVGMAGALPKWAVILFIYLIVLVMNFFVSSGSAKAFMLIPLIVPLAQVFGISAQLCIVAFAFGDGFSNVFYPTNAALLISLGLADVDYGSWFKWSWKFQAVNLALTSGILLLGLAVGYR